ncbi:hypothetical protein D779_1359 [Imhoffiella purpurea]|uniref:NAD-specific glutamate dehydrogenase n=1 Tax=Imhoffiella purpurea TaxID=1249627 RepID=W9VYD7_9GAMM|nr:hypothetical protein D779_1359 [Imhoffiella purpurea]
MLAVGVGAAADELAVASAFDLQGRTAERTGASLHDLGRLLLRLVGVEIAGVVAVRIVGAADEAAVAPEPDRELAAALGAGLVDALLGHVAALDVLLGVVDQILEGSPELLQERDPLPLAARDRVQIVLEPGGEVVVDVGGEILGQELVDHPPDVGRHEPLLVEHHVLAILQGGDDGGIGGRPADPELLQRLDQRCLRIARRRLGEVLLGADPEQIHQIALLEIGQHAVLVVVGALGVVAALEIDAHEPGLGDHGTGRPQQIARPGAQVDRHLVDEGMRHLAGQGALPDELVELGLLDRQMGLDRRGLTQDGGRTDGLVGLLGVLRLGLVVTGLLGKIRLAIAFGDEGPDLAQGLLGQIDRVGSHVGDETHGAAADVDALVELLGHAHGALGREPQLARRLLLQGRGDEGRRRKALALLALDLFDLELAVGRALEFRLDLVGTRLVGDAELLDLLAAEGRQLGAEGLRVLARVRLDGPVLLADECLDLALALADQTQRRTLHPTGRQSAPDLLPQQWRQIEADQIVERPSGLLGVDQIVGEAARIGDGVLDGPLGDLVEHDTVHGPLAELSAALEQLVEMPGDGLALAVRVGREIERLGLLELLGDRLDVLLVAIDDLVLHGEAMIRIDRPLLRNQVADVPIGGDHLEVGSEVLLDGLGLGRRFDDDEVHSGFWLGLTCLSLG